MRRRALLASLAAPLAGCSLAPAGPTTERYPPGPPNVFAAFDWDPDASALTVEFVRGNRITPENTGAILLHTVADEVSRTLWVGDDPDVDADAVAQFPLTPGDTVEHEMPAPADTTLVWEAPTGYRSIALDHWEAPSTRGTDR